jgi:multicomponent Na+:H+ antiporter subunit E
MRDRTGNPVSVIGLIFRAAVAASVWWVLTGGAADSWSVGLPAVAAAVWVDHRLSAATGYPWSLSGLVRFAVSFIKFSIAGGLDVIWRAYHPKAPLNPAMVTYPLHLSLPSARHLFAGTVSLLPGTLSVELDKHHLTVHVLDAGRPFERELEAIETRVAAIFRREAQRRTLGQ